MSSRWAVSFLLPASSRHQIRDIIISHTNISQFHCVKSPFALSNCCTGLCRPLRLFSGQLAHRGIDTLCHILGPDSVFFGVHFSLFPGLDLILIPLLRSAGLALKRSAPSKTKVFLYLDLQRGSGQTQELSWGTDFPSHGASLTPNFGESPSGENASTLSQILQAGVPERYYLSPKACLGILRRASVRGKELPEVLRIALERQAASA